MNAYNVLLSCKGNTAGVGGIVGNACFVKGSLANVITIEGSNITAAGGIAGSAFGTQCWKNGSKAEITGGSIFGCGVRGLKGISQYISNHKTKLNLCGHYHENTSKSYKGCEIRCIYGCSLIDFCSRMHKCERVSREVRQIF